MAGGIRGIRALRVQRAAIEEQISTARPGEAEEEKDEGADRFQMYGGKVAGQKAAQARLQARAQ